MQSELGAGSLFTVYLPDIETNAIAEASQGSGPLVLVIDDSPADGSLMERHLVRLGHRVEVVRDGAAGLARAQATLPAAIILDLEMPGMDGYDVLSSLGANEATAALPVIVSSQHDARERVLSLGAHSYLAKPVDKTLLREAMTQICVVATADGAQGGKAPA